ncbi:MAG TPA: phosphate acyltransferase, partial [Clostridia bacterium]|nr:phosphate acyltransferase [Clostridia bacterium]
SYYIWDNQERNMKLSLDSLARARYSKKPLVAVAGAQDECVLLSLSRAVGLGLCGALLIGDADRIRAIAGEKEIDLAGMEILPCDDGVECCKKAVRLVHDGQADAVMKGLVGTAAILHEVLDPYYGLREGKLLSYASAFELPGIDRLIYLTDPAMNMYPDLDDKKHIIENSLQLARALGNERPIVACLCAIEHVNPKMPCTLDAAELVRMNREGDIEDCTVAGPLALDNCLYRQAALHKGIQDPSAGLADILLAPEIETGNALYKAFSLVADAPHAGVLVGASAPVILTSRADDDRTKLNSIALAMRMAYVRMK